MIATALLLTLVAQDSGKESAIPGLVEIPAGRSYVGREVDDAKARIAAKPAEASLVTGETPRSRMNVDRFLISPTEITNEQYLRFVEATGYPPPVSWLRLTKEQRTELIKQGKEKDPAFILDDNTLSRWWEQHWQDPEYKWELLPEEALFPVSFVNRYDAEAYCRWAGLRLPLEPEWVRAARADTENQYPFGADFDRKIVASALTTPRNLASKVLPVNSFPSNASPYGCVDMVGNLWEWTASPYEALQKFKTFKVKIDKDEDIQRMPDFDPGAPVIKGGCYMSQDFAAQIDTRPGIQPGYRAPVVGFRVASSPEPTANAWLYAGEDISLQVLRGSLEKRLSFDRPLGLEKRHYANMKEIASRRAAPTLKGMPNPDPPEGYAIFDGYDVLSLLPSADLSFPSTDKLARETLDRGPLVVGALTTTLPLETPNLLPHTYVISYLGPMDLEQIVAHGFGYPAEDAEEADKIREKLAKKKVEGKKDDDPSYWPEKESRAGIVLNPEKDHLLFLNEKNEALAAVLIDKPRVETTRSAKKHHKTILNQARNRIDFRFTTMPDKGTKSFVFEFAVKPAVGDSGMDYISMDAWDNAINLQIKEKPPEPPAGMQVSGNKKGPK